MSPDCAASKGAIAADGALGVQLPVDPTRTRRELQMSNPPCPPVRLESNSSVWWSAARQADQAPSASLQKLLGGDQPAPADGREQMRSGPDQGPPPPFELKIKERPSLAKA